MNVDGWQQELDRRFPHGAVITMAAPDDVWESEDALTLTTARLLVLRVDDQDQPEILAGSADGSERSFWMRGRMSSPPVGYLPPKTEGMVITTEALASYLITDDIGPAMVPVIARLKVEQSELIDPEQYR